MKKTIAQTILASWFCLFFIGDFYLAFTNQIKGMSGSEVLYMCPLYGLIGVAGLLAAGLIYVLFEKQVKLLIKGLGYAALAVTALLAIGLFQCFSNSPGCRIYRVASVGGCDSKGYCMAKLSHIIFADTYKIVYMPVEGQNECACHQ